MAGVGSISESACHTAATRQVHQAVLQRQKHILIGDDDAAFCRTLRLMLQSAGYGVLTASNGAESIEAFVSRPDEIDLVVLDLSMSGMEGGETLSGLRRIRPDVKVVLCSGYGNGEYGNEAASLGWSGVLEKPVEAESLLRLVRELTTESP